jgi:hypothetical protein
LYLSLFVRGMVVDGLTFYMPAVEHILCLHFDYYNGNSFLIFIVVILATKLQQKMILY